MPEGEHFSFGVYVEGKKLPEYIIKKTSYTEVNLHGKESYTIHEDKQMYPVVPFTICLRRHVDKVMWVKVHVDGQTIASRPLKSCRFEVDGVKVGREIRELLFSLPKMEEGQDKSSSLGKHAGKIHVELFDAGWVLEKDVPVFRTRSGDRDHNTETRLHHLTKKDVGDHQKDAMGGIVTREGRTTKSVVPTGKFRTLKKYFPSPKKIEDLVLRYRPLVSSAVPLETKAPAITKCDPESSGNHLAWKIHDLSINEKGDGCIKNASRHPGGEKISGSRRRSLVMKVKPQPATPENVKTRESSASVLPEQKKKNHGGTKILPENIKTHYTCALPPTSTPKQVSKAQKEEKGIEELKWRTDGFALIDPSDKDDSDEETELCINDLESSLLYMGEQEELEGDSVIYMGDEDCCIFEPEPEEYSIIDVE